MTSFSLDRVLERTMVAGSAFVLLGAAAAVDDRVRGRAGDMFAGNALNELSAAREYVERALRQATDTVGYQTGEHGMLVFFAVAASILFFVMLRT